MNAEKLLQKWLQRAPKEASRDEVAAVMEHLGMTVRGSGHLVGSHPDLVGSDAFPNGAITVNCHAFGNQGQAHPSGIKDVIKAARIIQDEE